MPMQLPQSSGFERNECRSNRLADLEVGRIDLVELAAGTADLLGRMLEGAPNERLVTLEGAGFAGCDFGLTDGAVLDVGIGAGEAAEDGRVNTEVLGEDVFWGV
jgi:hypothetical protein